MEPPSRLVLWNSLVGFCEIDLELKFMIFYTENKLDNLFCPKCGNGLYRSTYFEHYPTYPYGCFKCDELITEAEAKTHPPENNGIADCDSAPERIA
jgi:hypothetical protein